MKKGHPQIYIKLLNKVHDMHVTIKKQFCAAPSPISKHLKMDMNYITNDLPWFIPGEPAQTHFTFPVLCLNKKEGWSGLPRFWLIKPRSGHGPAILFSVLMLTSHQLVFFFLFLSERAQCINEHRDFKRQVIFALKSF